MASVPCTRRKRKSRKVLRRGRCRPSMAGSESLSGSDNLPNIARVEPTAAFAEARLPVSRGQIRRMADLSAPADSKVCFGMPENPAPETSALSAKAAVGSTPKSSNLKIKNAMAKKIKGRPRSADPCGTTSIRTPAVEIRHAAGYLAYILCNWVKYDAKLVRTITRESGARPYARP